MRGISKKLEAERERRSASLVGRLENVLDFATMCLAEKVEALVDDPHGVVGGDREIMEYVNELRQLAVALGDDFDYLIDHSGTPFERDRLRKLMSENSASD
jgi:hypothetical protein